MAYNKMRSDILTFRANPTVREKLAKVAAAIDRPVSWLIEFYVTTGLEREHQIQSTIPAVNGADDRSSHRA
jgi:predicted transcriptional regulator